MFNIGNYVTAGLKAAEVLCKLEAYKVENKIKEMGARPVHVGKDFLDLSTELKEIREELC